MAAICPSEMGDSLVVRLPRLRRREDTASMEPSRLRVISLFCFFALIISAGLVAIYSVNMGASFLEKHDAPVRPETMQSRRSLTREMDIAEQLAGTPPAVNAAKDRSALSRADLAAAFVTDKGHEEYIKHSRGWRQGIKTYVGTNHTVSSEVKEYNKAAHWETWGNHPDDKPLHTLALKGDSRAALAPFLAFRDLKEDFKWLLYGDDDTYFFVDAVLKVVEKLDPKMPYFLTDHMWWTEKWSDANGILKEETHHPHKAAPLCVPCNYTRSTTHHPFPHPQGCPCTTDVLCSADTKGVFFKGPNSQCGVPRVPVRTYSMHGGAGAVISTGLLKAIPFKQFEDCVTTTYSTGGDAVISICLWQAGFGMTHPDPGWHPEGFHIFDVGYEAQDDSQEIKTRVARPLGNLLQAAAGFCNEGLCKLELEHFATLHMRSRKFPSRACFAEISRILTLLSGIAARQISSSVLTIQGKQEAFMNEQLRIAIESYKNWRSCQEEVYASMHKTKTQCRQVSGGLSHHGKKYASILKESEVVHAAYNLALEIIEQAFLHFPSPTGSYGDIPVGRE